MSIYEDLRDLCLKWDKTNDDYAVAARHFANQFTNGFATFLGAPGPYKTPFSNKQEKHVELLKTTIQEDGTIDYNELTGAFEKLNWDEDGFWHFGISLKIDPAPNAFPKVQFNFQIKFFLREAVTDLKIQPDGSFSFSQPDKASFTPAYDYMTKTLRKMLTLKPWEWYSQKPAIGFVTTKS